MSKCIAPGCCGVYIYKESSLSATGTILGARAAVAAELESEGDEGNWPDRSASARRGTSTREKRDVEGDDRANPNRLLLTAADSTSTMSLEALAGALVVAPGTPQQAFPGAGNGGAHEWWEAMTAKLADIREHNATLVAQLQALEQQTAAREEELASAQLDVHMHEEGRLAAEQEMVRLNGVVKAMTEQLEQAAAARTAQLEVGEAEAAAAAAQGDDGGEGEAQAIDDDSHSDAGSAATMVEVEAAGEGGDFSRQAREEVEDAEEEADGAAGAMVMPLALGPPRALEPLGSPTRAMHRRSMSLSNTSPMARQHQQGHVRSPSRVESLALTAAQQAEEAAEAAEARTRALEAEKAALEEELLQAKESFREHVETAEEVCDER